MSEVGRPTKLDEHLFRKIKDLVLDGNNLRQISEILEIPYATMRDWEYENYLSFSDKMLSFKHEKMLQKAELNLDALMGANDDKIRLDASKFVAETIGKKSYSKQINTDLTTGGKPIIQVASEIAEKNALNTGTEGNS